MKWKKIGTTKTLSRVGCPAKLSNRARRALVREVTKNPTAALTELQKTSAGMGELAGRMTISGLYGRVVIWKPLLSKRHMTAHLEFAERRLNDSREHEKKDSLV